MIYVEDFGHASIGHDLKTGDQSMSKLGGILFITILIIVVFGIASFSAEYFFGRPLMAFIKDFIFLLSKT